MRAIFDDPGSEYHELRRAFVRKTLPDRTPEHLRTAAQLTALAVSEVSPANRLPISPRLGQDRAV